MRASACLAFVTATLLAPRALAQTDPAPEAAAPELATPDAPAEPRAAIDWPEAPPEMLAVAEARNPRWERDGWDDGLVVAGVVLFSVSYLLAAIPIPAIWAGVHRTFFGNAPDVPYWPAAFLPLFPYVTQIDSTSSPFVFSLPSAIGQGLGLGLFLAGIFAHVDRVHVGTATLRVQGGALGAELGTGVELVF
jgi:hypothetical protein